MESITSIVFPTLLVIIGSVCIKEGYTTIKTQRTFWYAPNISGFKGRKNRTSSKGYAWILGLGSIGIGAAALLISIRVYWQIIK